MSVAEFHHAIYFILCLRFIITPCRSAGASTDSSLRLLDAAGSLSNVGLLEVRTEAGFGSVCGMNAAAASVACRQLGFQYGSVSASPCNFYGGANVCGNNGTAVSMQNLQCAGGELDIQSCSWSVPDAACQTHEHDAIVYCGNEPAKRLLREGAARLIASVGSPSLDGVGRLEIFHAGVWSSVCVSGFSHGSAQVACKSMGFSAAAAEDVPQTCLRAHGQQFCGPSPPALGELACDGSESDLLACPFEEGSDVFCAPGESVVLQCLGDGDAQGRIPKVVAPMASSR